MFDTISGAEKVGWLTLGGGTIVACSQVIRFLAKFFREHEMLLKNMNETARLVTRFPVIEEGIKVAKEERSEILIELRGLRSDINDVLKLMVGDHQKGN